MIFAHRIRSLDKFKSLLKKAGTVVCAIEDPENHIAIFKQMGFSSGLPEGESVLALSGFGPTCKKNADGWIEVHKDQPMETYYTPVMWRWKLWNGEWREEMRYRSGKRYPRTEHPPLGIELVIRLKTDGTKVAVLDFVDASKGDLSKIIDCVNMLVEIFGSCSLLTEKLDSIIKGTVKRLNWRILPLGRRPWEKLRKEILPMLEKETPAVQAVIEDRLETINQFEPPFTAIGTGGFGGYLIFGFPAKNRYVLESMFFGNATYVLGEEWERLSQMTKGQLISQNLYERRINHQEGWGKEIAKVLR